MSDDIVARLRAFYTLRTVREAADEIERLRSVVEAWNTYSSRAERDIAELRDQRDGARLQARRILNEIDCRIEHGAESNGHLEAIRTLFEEDTDDR